MRAPKLFTYNDVVRADSGSIILASYKSLLRLIRQFLAKRRSVVVDTCTQFRSYARGVSATLLNSTSLESIESVTGSGRVDGKDHAHAAVSSLTALSNQEVNMIARYECV